MYPTRPITHRSPTSRTLAARFALVLCLLTGLTGIGIGITASPAAAAVCPAAVSSGFTDVPDDHPFCREIAIAVDKGAISGYPDGTFDPTGVVTRQAAVKTLWNAINGGGSAAPCVAPPFPDVPVTNPFCGEIRDAAIVGVVSGYPDGSFHPADPVSRQAAVLMLSNFPDGPILLLACGGTDPFTDVSSAHPFCPQILYLKNLGAVTGYPDGSFHPTEVVTRQTWVAMLVRFAAATD